MSRGALKNKAKALKKEKAQKKAVQKRIVTISVIGVCVLVAIAVIVLRIYLPTRQGYTEIFSDGRQTITLFADGTFTADLTHNNQKTGTYTRAAEGGSTAGGRTAVLFIVDGATAAGRIEGDSLYFPQEWEDGHHHGNVLHKVNKAP